MTDEWRASVRATSPGWFKVPARLSREQVDAWVDETLTVLRAQWGEEWRDEDTRESEDLLRAAAVNRPDDKILDLLYWPFARPIVVRLNVRVYPSIPLSSWLEEGFEIDGFDNAGMGPAVRCIAQADTEIAGEQRSLITSHFVFDDGTFQVQAEVEPTLVELYSHVAFEVVNLVAGLEVHRNGDEPFRPQPVPGYTLADVDTFTGIDNA